jgi:hypothetical protein
MANHLHFYMWSKHGDLTVSVLFFPQYDRHVHTARATLCALFVTDTTVAISQKWGLFKL